MNNKHPVRRERRRFWESYGFHCSSVEACEQSALACSSSSNCDSSCLRLLCSFSLHPISSSILDNLAYELGLGSVCHADRVKPPMDEGCCSAGARRGLEWRLMPAAVRYVPRVPHLSSAVHPPPAQAISEAWERCLYSRAIETACERWAWLPRAWQGRARQLIWRIAVP